MGITPTQELLPARLRVRAACECSASGNDQYSLSAYIMNRGRALFLGHVDEDDVENGDNDAKDNSIKTVRDSGRLVVGPSHDSLIAGRDSLPVANRLH